jgi:hypothetical protein
MAAPPRMAARSRVLGLAREFDSFTSGRGECLCMAALDFRRVATSDAEMNHTTRAATLRRQPPLHWDFVLF